MRVPGITHIDDQIFNLYMVCKEYNETNKFSLYTYYAVSRYIKTGRSTRDFDHKFCELTRRKLKNMMEFSLKAGLSDDEILDRVKTYLRKQK